MSRKLVVLVPFCTEHMDRIRQAAGPEWEIEQYPAGLQGEELAYALGDAEVVIGEPDPQVLLDSPNVRWLQMTWAGTDKYTRGTVTFPKGAYLTNAAGGFGHIISQYVVGQTLAIMQNFPGYRENQLAHEWRDLGPVASLEGSTVLVFGAGDIGSHIARRLQGFGCASIVGVCRNTQKPRAGFTSLCTLDEAEKWLPMADVVACSIPNSDETAHYLDERRLGLMKPGSVLVNVGRGNFIDCAALENILAAGHLRGVALDVTDPEPLPASHPLWDEPRCLITPHTSGGSFGRHIGTETRICDICVDNMRRWITGKPLVNVILSPSE